MRSERTPSTDEEVFISPLFLMKFFTFEATTSTSLSDIATEAPSWCDTGLRSTSRGRDGISVTGLRDPFPHGIARSRGSNPDVTHLWPRRMH